MNPREVVALKFVRVMFAPVKLVEANEEEKSLALDRLVLVKSADVKVAEEKLAEVRFCDAKSHAVRLFSERTIPLSSLA